MAERRHRGRLGRRGEPQHDPGDAPPGRGVRADQEGRAAVDLMQLAMFILTRSDDRFYPNFLTVSQLKGRT